jgi:hypothetical protein
VPQVIDDLVHLPLGSHCVSFHVSQEEAADHAASFLAGTPEDQAASYWVGDASLLPYYEEKLAETAPRQVGCVHLLETEQVAPEDGHLRPIPTVKEFVGAHPEGVTAAGETLSLYWTRETIPEHMEYEQWFDTLPRDDSRFLCPYDLRRVPPELAPSVLRDLGAHHSHAVLSASLEPAVRLLQLFVFATPSDLPDQLKDSRRWAEEHGLIAPTGPHEEMSLTEAGNQVVREWSLATVVDLGPPRASAQRTAPPGRGVLR